MKKKKICLDCGQKCIKLLSQLSSMNKRVTAYIQDASEEGNKTCAQHLKNLHRDLAKHVKLLTDLITKIK